MRSDLPDGTVTLLLADMEGSRRVLDRLGEVGYADVLARYRALLRAAFKNGQGVEVDTQGDAFFVAFPHVAGAVSAAIESQRSLAREPWPRSVELKARMGLHTGTPQRSDEGYVGIDIHAAARVASSAHGGQIVLSGKTADLFVAEDPAARAMLRELGDFRLKDLDVPQRLVQIVIPELPSDFPPPRYMATRRNNLPASPTPFIGRAALVAELRDLVLRPDVRLVTLTGPGGTGKSRLGLRVAGELLARFDAGVYFVPLETVRDPRLVAAAIAAAIGLPDEPGRAPLDALVGHLANQELLLLIDHFDHVQSAVRDVAELLARCAGLEIIVSSRDPLPGLGGREFAVPPFSLPSDETLPPLAELARNEAVSLFVDRARNVRSDFALDNTNAAHVVAVCRQLDALPLAIELAAVRIRTMNPERLLRALDRRIRVSTIGGDDPPDQEMTLRDLILWQCRSGVSDIVM